VMHFLPREKTESCLLQLSATVIVHFIVQHHKKEQ